MAVNSALRIPNSELGYVMLHSREFLGKFL